MNWIIRKKALLKFLFWLTISTGLIVYLILSYTSGQMIQWYYYASSADGYAINAKTFMNATVEKPTLLTIGDFESIEGYVAVPVKKGDRLPIHADGVIRIADIQDGNRVALEGDRFIKVMVPWQIKEQKGFKYKDTFKHKGVQTNPWSGVWNVIMVLSLGLSLGLMAEGFTDVIGFNIEKIRHDT